MSENTPAIRPTDERLARLAARSAAQRASRPSVGPVPGGPLAPPGHGTDGAASTPPSRTAAPRAPRRRHAARGSRAMALALSVGTTVGLAGWFKVLDDADAASASGGIDGVVAASGVGVTPVAPVVTPVVTSVVTSAAKPAAPAGTALATGTWTGAASSTRWGPVQVAVTVAAGRISAVKVLQFPNRDNKSVSINNRALPTLVSETMTAQNARVDSVSGATYTSASYRASLQSALDAARAATMAST